MFFMMGIMPGRKALEYNQMVVCDACGKYGHYQVFMTYTVLSLFFIPVFKWNRQYYVQMSCCDSIYQLDPEVGRRIARGEGIEIRKDDLDLVQRGGRPGQTGWASYQPKQPQLTEEKVLKTCQYCGYTTEEDFEYCPKCGKHF